MQGELCGMRKCVIGLLAIIGVLGAAAPAGAEDMGVSVTVQVSQQVPQTVEVLVPTPFQATFITTGVDLIVAGVVVTAYVPS